MSRPLADADVDTRPLAAARLSMSSSALSLVWVSAIAITVFFLSNPLAFFGFPTSLSFASITVLIAMMVTGPRLRPMRMTWAVGATLLFTGFAWLSVTWSIIPSRSIDELAKMTVVLLLALIFAANMSAKEISQGVMAGGIAMITASVITAGLGVPGTRSSPRSGAWLNGIGTNANILAYCSVLTLAFAMAYIPASRRARYEWSVGVVILAVSTVASDSRTGIVAALAVILAGGLLLLGRAPGAVRNVVRIGLALSYFTLILLSVLLPWLLRKIGRGSITMNGRLKIWEAIASVSGLNGPLGHGWASIFPHPWEARFPRNADTSVLKIIRWRSKVLPTHGHSSVYDLLPQVGWLGVILLFVILLIGILSGLKNAWGATPLDAEQKTFGRLSLLGVLSVLICGLTEPIATLPIGWFLLIVAVCGASMACNVQHEDFRPVDQLGERECVPERG